MKIKIFFFHSYWSDSRLQSIFRTHELSGDYPVQAETVREQIQTAQTMYYYDKKLQVMFFRIDIKCHFFVPFRTNHFAKFLFLRDGKGVQR